MQSFLLSDPGRIVDKRVGQELNNDSTTVLITEMHPRAIDLFELTEIKRKPAVAEAPDETSAKPGLPRLESIIVGQEDAVSMKPIISAILAPLVFNHGEKGVRHTVRPTAITSIGLSLRGTLEDLVCGMISGMLLLLWCWGCRWSEVDGDARYSSRWPLLIEPSVSTFCVCHCLKRGDHSSPE